MKKTAKGPTESSIEYVDDAPEGVSAAVREALSPFEVRWCQHTGTAQMAEGGYPGILVDRKDWIAVFQALREKAQMLYLCDHTAVDYPERKPARFTVVALPTNLKTQERLIVKTRVAEDESVPSLTCFWKSADWAERETYDMFGIPFEGHPDLTRIYMPEDYEGWPMRRDFPLQGHLRFID